MILETERLILRPWSNHDAEALFELASNEKVGPITGWPPHTSVENSLEIIKNVFSKEHDFAICLKEQPEKVIGSIGIILNQTSERRSFMGKKDAEIGYWLGFPYWGKSFMPEAAKRVIQYCFNDLGMENVWAGIFIENNNSKRVVEKLGFEYVLQLDNVDIPLLNEVKTELFFKLTKNDWQF
ncbi:GNAT family N-acetyltransferase [Enterococcus sp. AZ103]|uniref:GNAT family N-acetyltransferase n=1 Tax=Enterococcus sp. AZ103 TaxID=2774628 RepID=UPI003F276D6D